METRAVEESFSWTPRSRKTFVREVPLLSRGRRSGLSRSGENGMGGGETSPRDLGARLWVHTEGPPPPPKRVVWKGGGQWGGD